MAVVKVSGKVSKVFGASSQDPLSCLGVVCYGVSASSTLLKGVCGVEQANNVSQSR